MSAPWWPYGIFSVAGNGRLVYLIGHGGGRLQWIDRYGRSLATLGDLADYVHVTLSRDEGRAAVGIFDEARSTFDLWIVDLERDVRSRLTSDAIFELPAWWSPSGDAVVFGSNPEGDFDVFQMRIDRPGEKQLLLDLDRHVNPTSWSRDGKLVTLASENEGDIWILPKSPGAEPFAFLETSHGEFDASLSPDSRWMAYASDESGQPDIYVASYPDAGRKVRVSTSGASFPWWRQDGRELLYHELTGQVVAVPVDGRGETFVIGESEPLFQVEPGLYPTYAPTADAQKFLVIRPVGDDRRPLTLIQNWTKLREP